MDRDILFTQFPSAIKHYAVDVDKLRPQIKKHRSLAIKFTTIIVLSIIVLSNIQPRENLVEERFSQTSYCQTEYTSIQKIIMTISTLISIFSSIGAIGFWILYFMKLDEVKTFDSTWAYRLRDLEGSTPVAAPRAVDSQQPHGDYEAEGTI
jgi:hypothetical protein